MLFLAHSYGCQQLFWTGKNGGPRVTDHSSDVRYYGEVVVDRGFYQLWPCLIPWLLFEAAVGYAWLHHIAGLLMLCLLPQVSPLYNAR